MRVIQSRDMNVPVKVWDDGVTMEQGTIDQVSMIARLPFILDHVALMPDGHKGIGSTVGSVIPTIEAIVPAGIGVDIGCGVVAVRTSLTANDLPDNLLGLREAIEQAVPHGGPGSNGSWAETGRYGPPNGVTQLFINTLDKEYRDIVAKHPKVKGKVDTNVSQLGTLGSGNHYIEICLDEMDRVWVMLHSGSRGVGNRIGEYFINLAKEEMKIHSISLPDKDLAYLKEGTKSFDDYWFAVQWAQKYAATNRHVMMNSTLAALQKAIPVPFKSRLEAVDNHHNYVAKERHYGRDVYITRKGAVSAKLGQMGIIPGSMGSRSYIVSGLGNPESFTSCSHGAGRKMSRGEAKRTFTVEDHIKATEGIECRKDIGVLDETVGAYKDIDSVIAAQLDLVEVVHTLHQVVNVKG